MKKRTISYLALLSAPILVLGITLTVSPARARVQGTTTMVNTVLQPRFDGLTGDCLVEGGHTVLLGTLEAGETMEITLTLEGTEATECQLTASGQSEALTVTMAQVPEQTEETQTQEEQTTEDPAEVPDEELPTPGPLDLTVTPESPVKVTLTFTALETLTEPKTEQIRIICGSLTGTFRLDLIPKTPEPTEPVTEPREPVTEPTDPVTEPSEPVTEPTEPVTEPSEPVTDPTVAQLNENTESENDSGTGDDGNTGSTGDENADGEGNTDAGDGSTGNTSGEGDDGTGAGSNTGNTGDENTGSTEDPPAETEPVIPTQIQLAVPTAFALDRCLPVKLTVTGSAELVTIGMDINDFPALTRYSTDGGQSWYQLYFGGAVELQLSNEEPAWPQLLLLDFSRTDVKPEDVLTLTAGADGEVLAQSDTVTVSAPVPQSTAVPVLWLPTEEERAALDGYLNPPPTEPMEPTETQPEAQTVEDTPTEITEPAETTQPAETTEPSETTQPTESQTEAQTVAESEPATTDPTDSTEPTEVFELEMLPESGVFENDYFAVPLPAGWDQRVYILERLERQEDGTRAYKAGTWAEDQSLVLQETADALVITPGATPPKAGTYRLTIQYLFEETCIDQMQMTFFINYSTRSDAQQEEVPDNE